MSDSEAVKSSDVDRKSMPTGVKIAIGCAAAVVGLGAVLAIVIGVGGFWLKGKADDFVAGVQTRAEAQQEATEILDRLRSEHPFAQPPDGIIDAASADRFFRVTGLAWAEIEPEVSRLHEIAERNREGDARLGDVVEGFRASGVLIDSRLHIARALDEVGMSLAEYVWTGGALQNAWRDANAPEAYRGSSEAGDPVMTANIELARRHAAELQTMDRSGDEPNPSIVLSLAQAWTLGQPSASDITP